MKRILTVLFLGLYVGSANASVYKLDETHLNQLFEESSDVSYLAEDGVFKHTVELAASEGEKSQVTAGIIALATVVVGGTVCSVIYQVAFIVTGGVGALFCWPILFAPLLPYHRYYLGTEGQNLKLSALYCVTLSWCGWLHVIDGIMLLVDDSKSKYIGSTKYVMWID